jgi:hypothetical protein
VFPLPLPPDTPRPNFFIVGAMRAGTTALANVLVQHPQVFFCPIKEPGFFATDIARSNYGAWHRKHLFDPAAYVASGMKERKHLAFVEDPGVYADLFAKVHGQKAVGEASTAYLFSGTAAEAIAAEIPDARIIITLRNPYERAFSEYLMNKAIGSAVGSFSDSLARERAILDRDEIPFEERYVFASLYFAQVKRYFDNFPRENLLVLRYEDLADNSGEILRRLYRHLGVDPALGDTAIFNPNPRKLPRFEAANKFLYRTGLKQAVSDWAPKSVKDRFAPLFYSNDLEVTASASDWAQLKDLFEPDIAKLRALLGADFWPWAVPVP